MLLISPSLLKNILKRRSMNCHERFRLESNDKSFTEGEAPTEVESTQLFLEAQCAKGQGKSMEI